MNKIFQVQLLIDGGLVPIIMDEKKASFVMDGFLSGKLTGLLSGVNPVLATEMWSVAVSDVKAVIVRDITNEITIQQPPIGPRSLSPFSRS